MLANSILVVIENKGAAMCTRQGQNRRRRACSHIITTYWSYCLCGTGTPSCWMGGASIPPSSRESEDLEGGHASRGICSRTQDDCTGSEFHRRMLPPIQDRTSPSLGKLYEKMPKHSLGKTSVLGKHCCKSAGSVAPTCDTPCDEVLPEAAAGLDRWAHHERNSVLAPSLSIECSRHMTKWCILLHAFHILAVTTGVVGNPRPLSHFFLR